MKKTRYKVVANPLEGYDFSFSRCHAAEIGAYVIGIGIAVLICALTVCYAEEGRGWINLRDNIIYPITFSIPLLIGGLSMTLRIRKVKKIMTDGEKVEGEVVSYRRKYVSRGSKNSLFRNSNYTILKVTFYHNGKQTCSVGAGHKMPEKALVTPHCTVYIFNDTIFVTEFDLRKKGDSQIKFELKEHSILDD